MKECWLLGNILKKKGRSQRTYAMTEDPNSAHDEHPILILKYNIETKSPGLYISAPCAEKTWLYYECMKINP